MLLWPFKNDLTLTIQLALVVLAESAALISAVFLVFRRIDRRQQVQAFTPILRTSEPAPAQLKHAA
jgi:hypothetical protein